MKNPLAKFNFDVLSRELALNREEYVRRAVAAWPADSKRSEEHARASRREKKVAGFMSAVARMESELSELRAQVEGSPQ